MPAASLRVTRNTGSEARARIVRIDDTTRFDTLFDPGFWNGIGILPVSCFPWHRAGSRQGTTVRCCWNAGGIAVEFSCEDRHISSQVVTLNGPVWTDSCVEFFGCPYPMRSASYFNLEVNACGTFLFGYGADRNGRRLIDTALASSVRIHHSVPGTTKAEHPDDRGWRIVLFLPFHVIGALAGGDVRPSPGTQWSGNFYRCGGNTDAQHACWSCVTSPVPDFHRPQDFGTLHFL